MSESARRVSISPGIWTSAQAAAERERVVTPTAIRAALALAFGITEEVVHGIYPLQRVDPEMIVRDPLGLLGRALDYPIRAGSAYSLAEVLAYLGLDKRTVQQWERRGLLRVRRSLSKEFAHVLGSNLLTLGLRQGHILVRAFKAAERAPRWAGSETPHVRPGRARSGGGVIFRVAPIFWHAVEAQAARLGISPSALITTTLARTFDSDTAQPIQHPKVLRRPLPLLAEALRAPVALDGIYAPDELGELVGVSRRTLGRWLRRRWLRADGAGPGTVIHGPEILDLLFRQALLHVAPAGSTS